MLALASADGVASGLRRRQLKKAPAFLSKASMLLVGSTFTLLASRSVAAVGTNTGSGGTAGDLLQALVIALGLMLGLLLALARPEILLPLYIFAGQFKGLPVLAALQRSADLTVLLALLVVISVIQALQHTEHIYADRQLLAAWLLFCTLLLAGLLLGQAGAYGFAKCSQFSVLGSLALIAPLVLVRSLSSAHRSLCAFAVFAAIYCSAALLTAVLSAAKTWFVLLPGANYLALGRIAGVGVIIALFYLIPSGRRHIPFGIAILVICTSALLLSGGRGPVVAAGLAVLLIPMVGAVIRRRNVHAKILLIVTLALAVGCLVHLQLLPHTLSRRFSLLISTLTHGASNASVVKRLDWWRSAFDAMLAHPLLGLGTGGFSDWFARLDARLYPHNIFLEVGAELGLLGLVLLFYLLFRPIAQCVLALRRPSQPRFALLCTAALSILLFSWANAMVSGDLNDNRMLFMASGLLVSFCRVVRTRHIAASSAVEACQP